MIRVPTQTINNQVLAKYARSSLQKANTFTSASSSTSDAASLYKNSDADSSAPDISLFQYAICPFCNINKALLAYTNTPYTVIEVNPLTKVEIKFSKDYRKVPIAMIDGSQVNDSKTINNALLNLPFVLKNLSQKNDLSMEAFQDSPSARRWETFAREDLAPILYPNICSSLGDSYQAFGYVDSVDHFTATQKILIRGIGSLAMYFAASKIKSEFHISNCVWDRGSRDD
jgi:microsomal prostaglandin-E synthase 2